MSKKSPQLRFEGFTDDWEERKLGDVGNTFTGLTGKTKEDFGHGSAKFVTYVNVFKNPIATLDQLDAIEIDEKQNQVQKGDIFFTTSSETPEEVGMSSVWTHDTENVYLNSFTFGYRPRVSFDLNYMASMLRSPSIRKKITFLAQGISRYNISKTKMLEIEIPTPTLSEQEKIGSFFKQLDNTIALHQRKLDLLKEQKKGYLQKMFPKNGAKVPELRFAGFADDWEERKLDELVEQIIREVPKPNKPYYRMSVRSHAKGTFRQFVDNPDNVAMDKLFIVKKDDLVVNITFAWEHAIAVVKEENDGLLVSHRFPTYRADGKSDIKFLNYVVSKEDFRRKLEFISPGGAGRNRVLNKKDFLKLKIFVPKIEEQQKIGSFFKQLDNTIALHQRKLDLLKEQKKGFLQKMFV